LIRQEPVESLERLRRMIRHIALAAIFVQVAMAAALATQVSLFSAANAQDITPSQVRPTAAHEACEGAIPPNIPDRCPRHVEPTRLTLVLSAGQ
jgi:hypothetical protein